MVALIIEDERHVARVLARMLGDLGFETFEAPSADAADELLLNRTVNLILLDLRLEGRSGDEWLISFRRTNQETPVMAISSVRDSARRAAVLRDGADHFIGKPFDIVELEAHVCALLRRPRTGCERSIFDGTVSLNPARSSLRVCELQHVLTQREFQIMWCLALREGLWVSATSLAQSVFCDTSDTNVEAIRVHVSNMRQKMSYLSDHFQIDAGRRLGYRIVR